MQRRKFIAGVGSLAAAGAAGIGTGAFTSVQADRGITVDTANDANAFLTIEAMDTPNGNDYVKTVNGAVKLDFSETDEGGSGVNRDATTVFDDLLKITNQGTQTVIVGHRQDFAPADGALYHEDDDVAQVGDSQTYGNNYGTPDNDGITNLDTASTKNLPALAPGQSLTNVGFFVTPGASASEDFIDGTITFTAGDQPSDIGL